MQVLLNPIQARVLGSLMEKELATPDYYPLSLNNLTNACNQKSNRDPVVAYDEQTVLDALDELQKIGLVWKSGVGRVPKFEERFTHDRKFVVRESAVLCILLLRGPQTAGEIRTRATRLYGFKDLEEVLETLNQLEQWGDVRRLPVLPGHKESRWTHLLCGEPETGSLESAPAGRPEMNAADSRLQHIEEEMDLLRDELEELKTAFQAFREQFE